MAIIPVTREAHGARSWRRFSDYRFAAAVPLARLAGAEIAQAALSLPLVFAEADGKPVVAALLGFRQGQNLFVGPDGRWLGRYVPAAFRGWPFQLARSGEDRLTLCFDDASGLLAGPGEGEPFFAEDGQPGPALRQVLDFLTRTQHSQAGADAAAALLAEHGLLEPWPLKVRDGENERPVQGLSRVSEAALNGLSAEALKALRDGSALALAYAQLLSMGNIGLLGQLAAAHAGAARQAQQKTPNGRDGELAAKLFRPDDGSGMIDWKKLLEE
ncbi:MAG: SapC family protein [Rhizobiales bacterium]|nr:SapC family protein [Hyphomicrobiales bacterium]